VITKYTPGPWQCKGGDVFDAEGGLVVSLTNSWKRDKASRDRDAADPLLIAAAPEMLEALMPVANMEMWTESAEDGEMIIMTVGTIKKMRAAIAKALGQ